MNEHLLQSEIWEKYEKLEGKQTFRLTDADFDCLVTKSSTPFGNYLYLPYGPSLRVTKEPAKTQKSAKKTTKTSPNSTKSSITTAKNSLKKALEGLRSLAETENAYFIRIEPTTRLEPAAIASAAKAANLQAKKSKNLDPEHTWVLDLTNATEDELLKNMESRKVRYWKNAEKKGIRLKTTKDPEKITILTDFLKNLGEKDNFTPQTENHLKNQLKSGFATLYIAELSDEGGGEPSSAGPKTWASAPERPKEEGFASSPIPIAAALVYDHEGTRYYAHAATDFEHRKLQAGSIILIQLILDAKRSGAKTFDFWGITKSEDPNHPWYHFTQYKKSFGGREVAYSGTYDLILNPKKYRLYQAARKLNRWLRRHK